MLTAHHRCGILVSSFSVSGFQPFALVVPLWFKGWGIEAGGREKAQDAQEHGKPDHFYRRSRGFHG